MFSLESTLRKTLTKSYVHQEPLHTVLEKIFKSFRSLHILRGCYKQYSDTRHSAQVSMETAMNQGYKHQPLSYDDSIRVLEVLPGQSQDPLAARLRDVRLSDQPSYIALSYTWGDAVSEILLRCDEQDFYITQSLSEALKNFRNETQSLVVWVDQVCIDQSNFQERGHQVQLMSRIYANAQDVFVWLGMSTPNSDLIFNCMEACSVVSTDAPRLQSAVAEFLDRPWFERTWIVQEVVLSRNDPKVFCGTNNVSFSLLDHHLLLMKESVISKSGEGTGYASLFPHSYDYLNSWNSFLGETNSERAAEIMKQMLAIFFKGLLRFKEILNMRKIGPSALFGHRLFFTKYQKATDPRDKIFGILGICMFESDPIIPDYSKTVTRVYSEAMAHLILNQFDMGYLQWMPSTPWTTNPGSLQDLPGWVPDFSTSDDPTDEYFIEPSELSPPKYSLVAFAAQQASHRTPLARFSEDFRVLYTHGIEFGVVAARFSLLSLLQDLGPVSEPWLTAITWQCWFSAIEKLIKNQTHKISMKHVIEVLHFPHSGLIERWEAVCHAFQQLKELTAGPLVHTLARDSSLLEEYIQLDRQVGPGIKNNGLKGTLFVTENGRIGRCIGPAEKGDLVAGLFGIDMPFILKKRRKGRRLSDD